MANLHFKESSRKYHQLLRSAAWPLFQEVKLRGPDFELDLMTTTQATLSMVEKGLLVTLGTSSLTLRGEWFDSTLLYQFIVIKHSIDDESPNSDNYIISLIETEAPILIRILANLHGHLTQQP